jgi:hypothetical protein
MFEGVAQQIKINNTKIHTAYTSYYISINTQSKEYSRVSEASSHFSVMAIM